jgi:uncharacterized protein (DUF1778 family)
MISASLLQGVGLTAPQNVRTIALQEETHMAAETINMRTDSERKRRLQVAADLSDETLTAFVLAAADDRAAQVIADRRTSPLPAEFFDEFFDALAPEPTPALIDAAARLRQSVRRDN